MAWEGPGLIATVARDRGLDMQVRRMDRGDAVPSADDVGGLIVMGGPMSVYEAQSSAQLGAVRDLLRSAVGRDVPVLGVCLGAQILAAALGANVYKGTGPEVGFGTVVLTAAGREDAVLQALGDRLPVFHWHGDTFDLPARAVHLGTSDAYANQAFRAGHDAYGLQFHVELDRGLADAWLPHLPAGVGIDEHRRAEIERAGCVILGRFFEMAVRG